MNWYKKCEHGGETIVAAAISLDGKVYSVPKPGRHHHVIKQMIQSGVKPACGIQGFLTSQGRFVNRQDGAKIALDSGQVAYFKTPPDLFSEDLW